MEAAQGFAFLHPSVTGKGVFQWLSPQQLELKAHRIQPLHGCQSIAMVPFAEPVLQPQAGATEGKLGLRNEQHPMSQNQACYFPLLVLRQPDFHCRTNLAL